MFLISSSDYIWDALAVYKSSCKTGVPHIIDYCGSVFLWYIEYVLDTSPSVNLSV